MMLQTVVEERRRHFGGNLLRSDLTVFVESRLHHFMGGFDSFCRRCMFAARRLAVTDGLEVLSATPDAERLAMALLEAAALPSKAAIDAVHVALAAVHGMNVLLTWNCTHIANALMRPHIERVCRENGVAPPIICTPEELHHKREDA